MEPILDMYKPPGLIKKIYFRRLTFGNAPIRIDNVWVDKQTPEELILEVCPGLMANCTIHSFQDTVMLVRKIRSRGRGQV